MKNINTEIQIRYNYWRSQGYGFSDTEEELVREFGLGAVGDFLAQNKSAGLDENLKIRDA